MANSKYIKVTPKGADKPVVVLGTLAEFYLSQNALVEPATLEEAATYYPEAQAELSAAPEEQPKPKKAAKPKKDNQ